MKKNSKKAAGKIPFYAQLLSRSEIKNTTAGATNPLKDQPQTDKYPSDWDETNKYPSDGDDTDLNVQ